MKNGATIFCETLLANQINVCFANPGTSEMHFVGALDQKSDMRCILGLFEGVVTGAADGYARMADKPAATLLHLGPGLANGLANLHNAKKAYTPMVNVIGDHATYHVQYDAPLTSDTEGVARPMSDWVQTVPHADAVAEVVADGIQAAYTGAGRVASVILPANAAWDNTQTIAKKLPKLGRRMTQVDDQTIQNVANVLNKKVPTLILLGGMALRQESLALVERIAHISGAHVMAETFCARIQRGQGRMPIKGVPYAVPDAVAALSSYEQLILVGAKIPVGFFAYPNRPSVLIQESTQVTPLCSVDDDPVYALDALAHLISAPAHVSLSTPSSIPLSFADGPLDAKALCHLVAQQLPEQAIVCAEAVSQGGEFPGASAQSAPHDVLMLTGGAIGIGLPLAVGAAVACPARKVISLQADGSGMYTLQALWTQARERLNVLTIIFANQRYNILHHEMANVGVGHLGNNALSMLNLDNPSLNWVAMAQGMGVDAVRVDSVGEFKKALAYGLAQPGPYLIEALIP